MSKYLPANYKTWARRPYWEVHEVARLVIGHDPIRPHPRKALVDDGTDSPEQSFALREVIDVLNRCIKAHLISEPLNPSECVKLLQRHGVSVPEGLLAEVDAVAKEKPDLFAPRDSERVIALEQQVRRLKRQIDERQIGSLLKILWAVANRKYRLEEKSIGSVAKAIEGDAIEAGIKITDRTIQDCLNMAREHCSK